MRSMTGFATAEGQVADQRWRWEAKSVNGRGLDLRFRLTEPWDSFEQPLRSAAASRIKRGNLSFALRTETTGSESVLKLNPDALRAAMEAASQGEDLAAEAGLHLAPAAITSFLSLKGVMEAGSSTSIDSDAFEAETKASFERLIDALDAARAAEGERLKATFVVLIDEIAKLTARAEAVYISQQADAPDRLRAKVAALTEAGAEIAPDRLTQEFALLAVKADIREELDRLASHITAARSLIEDNNPVGRKLDFLTQEFNREANTLCSKSGSPELTAVGLELKVAIDQMREQAQNVE